jgi:hypothetical protein
MKNKKARLIDVFMPPPVGWVMAGALFLLFLIYPHFLDRIFDFMDKGIGYRAAIAIIALLISIPYYLKLKKRLHKYEEDKWDDK